MPGDTQIVANAGAGGSSFKVDDDGTAVWPYAKLAWGPGGTRTEVADADGSRLPVQAVITPKATGGLSKYHAVVAASTNAASIKGSAGSVYAVRVFNNALYPIFVKFHNTNVVPTAGSGVVETIGVQAGESYFGPIDAGDAFTTGIGVSIVKGIADNDTTVLAANDGVVDVYFV